jgi:hypothetical protein
MKFALMTRMIAFFSFADLIVWFSLLCGAQAQKIAVTHLQNMGVFASVVLPSVLFLQLPSEIDLHRPRVFMCSGYIVAWVTYIA